MRAEIDWSLIGDAIEFYKRFKFKYVEVPWMVFNEAIDATIPVGKQPFYIGGRHGGVSGGALVGSAEQSFLQLMLDGKLEQGRYVTASPCFRDDEVDELHFKDFFKVELIHVIDDTAAGQTDADALVNILLQTALHFFASKMSDTDRVRIVTTDIGRDIFVNGVEVGSYGYRTYRGHHWIYGTGLAEPRFSQARSRR